MRIQLWLQNLSQHSLVGMSREFAAEDKDVDAYALAISALTTRFLAPYAEALENRHWFRPRRI